MNNDAKLLVINVLTREYYDECHIKGSINMSLNDLKTMAENLDRGVLIVVYCASYVCSASIQAWHMLYEMGFSNIWAYEGGINEWLFKGYPVEGSCQKEYLKHPVPEPAPKDSEIREISAHELKVMMEEHGLL